MTSFQNNQAAEDQAMSDLAAWSSFHESLRCCFTPGASWIHGRGPTDPEKALIVQLQPTPFTARDCGDLLRTNTTAHSCDNRQADQAFKSSPTGEPTNGMAFRQSDLKILNHGYLHKETNRPTLNLNAPFTFHSGSPRFSGPNC